MELNVTNYARNTEHGEISGSQAELGPDAGPYTWRNAQAEAEISNVLSSPDAYETARAWLREFGAWTDEELSAMPDRDVHALILQFVSGDIREAQSCAPDDDDMDGIDWPAYRAMQEQGTCASYLYRADDGDLYFSLY